jgi:hypothetical protein
LDRAFIKMNRFLSFVQFCVKVVGQASGRAKENAPAETGAL